MASRRGRKSPNSLRELIKQSNRPVSLAFPFATHAEFRPIGDLIEELVGPTTSRERRHSRRAEARLDLGPPGKKHPNTDPGEKMHPPTLKRAATGSPDPSHDSRRNTRRKIEAQEVLPLSKMPASKALLLSGVSGPTVDIFLKSNPEKKYTLSKTLLCEASSYFIACLDGQFKEAHTQTIHLDPEIETEPFEMLLQFMLTGEIFFGLPEPGSFHYQNNSAAEPPKSQRIHIALTKGIKIMHLAQSLLLDSSPGRIIVKELYPYFEDELLYFISASQHHRPLLVSHIEEAWKLPRHNPLRKFIAKIAAQQYLLQTENKKAEESFDFDAQLENVEGFARDMMVEVVEAVRSGAGRRETCIGPMLLDVRIKI